MSTKSNEAPKPTDLDLMLYADGELEGDQLAAVEAYLAKDQTARQKLLAMGMTSSIVREQALGRADKGDDIADLVMASLDSARSAQSGRPAISAEQVDVPADEKADVVPMRDGSAGVAPTPARRKPANDNARGLWAIAAVAAAAAAALLLWSRSPAPHRDHDVAANRTPAASPVPHDDAKNEAPEGDVEHGVEVAAVDFGALTGAVFYVPSDSAAVTTTVVWLSDDSSGGDE